jgi:hypothetical protein
MINIIKGLIAKRYFIAVFLLIHFLLNLLLYLNTNSFREISDSSAIFDTFDFLLAGRRPALLFGGYCYGPAYVAWFFFQLFGNLYSYFIFQCLLTTISTYIVYRIVLQISENKVSGAIAIFLLTIYTEYLLLSSVFYNQVFEIFFTALMLWITLLLFREKYLLRSLIFILIIGVVVVVSTIFRGTLSRTYYYFFAAAIVCIVTKHYRDFFKFLTLSLILYFVIVVLSPTDLVREPLSVPSTPFFWGHTMYGGKGGENGFIYQKNKDLYNKRLKEYVIKNKIDTIDQVVINKFRENEVSRFIREEPHKWVFLQFKKFFNTFGSVPIRDGLIMLMKGNISFHWILSAVLLQIPFISIMLLFLLSIDYKIKTFLTLSNYKFLVYILGFYLITATCFYIGTMDRYRVVVLVMFFIPVIAINRKKLKTLFLLENRKELFVRLFFICIFIAIWIYQAYVALVIDADRYFRVVQ